MAVIAAGIAPACFDPDPRDPRGALDLAARAIEAGDGRQLFKVIDERARHAMISIVKDRREAATLIRADYPEPERPAALSALGDAAEARDAADLFVRRCPASCMAALARRLGAPASERRDGRSLQITTAAGEQLELHLGSDTWWGLAWKTDALSAERDRAARELAQIRDNAEIYRRRRALEAEEGARSAEGSSAHSGDVGSETKR
ncbi:MAG: hypothetical protein PVI30_08420 [Myxococcales bacterium]